MFVIAAPNLQGVAFHDGARSRAHVSLVGGIVRKWITNRARGLTWTL